MIVSTWLGQFVDSLQLGYGFSAGAVSAVNPCGFALLPAYLTLFLGAAEEGYEKQPTRLRLMKAIWVGLNVTAGFSLLFLVIGALFLLSNTLIASLLPWFSLVLGIFLLVLGGWMLSGNHFSLTIMLKLAGKVGDPRDITLYGFFLFGVAFGISSLGCTLPIFLAVVGSSFAQGNFLEGMKQFGVYVAGAGTVLTALAVSISLLKEGVLLPYLRKIQPLIGKISAWFLFFAGGFMIYHWFMNSGMSL